MVDFSSNLDIWWRFLEGQGTNVADFSRNGRNGTLVNSPIWLQKGYGPNRRDGGLTFDGNTTYVWRNSYTFPTTGSVSWWAKPSRAYNSGVLENMFHQGTSATGLLHWQHWSGDNQSYIGFYRNTQNDRITQSGATAWGQNIWQMHSITWTSGGGTTFYRNGVQIGTDAATDTSIAGVSLLFGVGESLNLGFSGDMGDFRMYSRALSDRDVLALYQSMAIYVPKIILVG